MGRTSHSVTCVLRQCGETDVRAIRALQESWDEEEITYGFRPADEATIAGAIGPYFYLAEADGQIVGFVAGSVREGHDTCIMPDGQAYLEIDDLYVRPEFRAQGIGRRLLDKVLEEAKARGVRKAFIYSSTKDLFRAMRFYESAGFQPWFARMFCEL